MSGARSAACPRKGGPSDALMERNANGLPPVSRLAEAGLVSQSNRHNEHLRRCLIDPRFEPSQLTLVAVLHVLESVEQSLIPKSARRLFKDNQRHHAFIYKQPKIVEVTEHVKSPLASFHEQGLIESFRLTFPSLAVLGNK